MPALLDIHGLDVVVAGRTLVRDLSLAVQPGERVAVLGQNGAGKSLTLHTLAGLRPPARGTISVGGVELRLLGHRERALRLGLLLQEQDDPFPTSAMETALMGRHARLGIWQWETAEDHTLARNALAAMDLAGMEQRLCATLSGGERRRLGVAALLVQDPDLWLLDEPLNHLDPRHQFTVLGALQRLAGEGKAVMASLHDPILAARHFDSALLLHGDGRWQHGPVSTLLDAQTLAGLYGVDFEAYQGSSGAIMLPVPQLPGTRLDAAPHDR